MDYKSAQLKSLEVLWTTEECREANCWCSAIIPKAPIIYRETDDGIDQHFYIARAGELDKEIAEHIVSVHNQHVRRMAMAQMILDEGAKNIKDYYDNQD